MAGLYIHIPFCKQKCHYCNFFSLATTKYRHELKEALLKEIETRKNFLNNETLKTIYFGGGTPSLYEPDEIETIITKANQIFGVEKNAEITLEANPDNLTDEWLRRLRKTPVNRLSIGIQSFRNEDLEYLNRIHSSHEAVRSVKTALKRGFDNINVDLIFGIPTLKNDNWIKNIETAINLGVPHISAYALTVEPGTALDLFIRKGKYRPLDESKVADQFKILTGILWSKGFDHYEISNFAKEGNYARHNTSYWCGEKYLGIGPSAHSYDFVTRSWNVSSLKKYIEGVNTGSNISTSENLTTDQHYNEYVMTSIRTMWGIDILKVKSFGDKYYHHLIKKAARQVAKGLIFADDKKIKLTDEGKLFADGIAAGLFF
jgi:oxygen-independent coproporphyrinogen III oxidase